MTQENKYNHDSVNELLTWAKDVLDNKKYPSGEFQLDKCAKILDCLFYVFINMISAFISIYSLYLSGSSI